MQDRTSANSMKVLLQRAAGPYIGVRPGHSAMSAQCPVCPKTDMAGRRSLTNLAADRHFAGRPLQVALQIARDALRATGCHRPPATIPGRSPAHITS
jgi:hypothetical protein